jgi:L-lactate dehydrogenase complex protein LldG
VSTLSGARADMLRAIRSAMPSPAEGREADYASIQRDYRRRGELSADARLALFVDRLEHYNVVVRQVPEKGLTEAIEAACRARPANELLIPAGLDRSFLPDGVRWIDDAGLQYEELDTTGAVLTLATLGIALTGTIVLTHSTVEGRRALTLIPDYHLCVVRADQVVETVPEAIETLSRIRPAVVTTISGPSATADIEMTRVRGVHGPRTLEVIVVGA